MRSRHLRPGSLAGAFFFAVPAALAAIQVVDDSACERYAVDIASFATCEDGRVVKPADEAPPRAAGDAAATAKKPEPRADAATSTLGARPAQSGAPRAQPR
jgi:hypothetical protein